LAAYRKSLDIGSTKTRESPLRLVKTTPPADPDIRLACGSRKMRQPIRLTDIPSAVRALAPDAIKPKGYVKHGYAIPLTRIFVESLKERFPVGWPAFFD